MLQLKWIPNLLSGLRILMALAFPFAASQQRLPILVLALLTEYLDGFLARKYNWTTISGQVLDPIADKLFTLSIGLTFVALNKLSLMHLIFISVRDIVATSAFIISVLVLKKYDRITNFRPLISGKITTAFQYFVFINLALAATPSLGLILLTGLLSVVSAVIYGCNFRFTYR